MQTNPHIHTHIIHQRQKSHDLLSPWMQENPLTKSYIASLKKQRQDGQNTTQNSKGYVQRISTFLLQFSVSNPLQPLWTLPLALLVKINVNPKVIFFSWCFITTAGKYLIQALGFIFERLSQKFGKIEEPIQCFNIQAMAIHKRF